MRKFYQNKLWRDKLIAAREGNGAVVHAISLTEVEYNEELGMKLLEEANEVYSADTREEMMDEIVDVLETIDCILNYHKISKDEIMKLKETKLAKFGSYADRRLIDYVEYPVGSQEEKHCLDNPDSYPELCDEEDQAINNCCK